MTAGRVIWVTECEFGDILVRMGVQLLHLCANLLVPKCVLFSIIAFQYDGTLQRRTQAFAYRCV